jgi:hypothetical protein
MESFDIKNQPFWWPKFFQTTTFSRPPKKGLKKEENKVWYQNVFFKDYRDQLTNSLKR